MPICANDSLIIKSGILGPFYIKNQHQESLDPNNSILNLLLDLKRNFIKIHFGPKKEVWLQKLYGIFCWARTKENLEPEMYHIDAMSFWNTLFLTSSAKPLGPIFSSPTILEYLWSLLLMYVPLKKKDPMNKRIILLWRALELVLNFMFRDLQFFQCLWNI